MLLSVWGLEPEATAARSAALTTAANITMTMNFFMSASITHHEELLLLGRP
jgi:hypothetical protein